VQADTTIPPPGIKIAASIPIVMISVCTGDFCGFGTDIVFKNVLQGIVPLSWLGYRITGKCTNVNHTTACIACFNCQTFYLAAENIRDFLWHNRDLLKQRKNWVSEINALAITLYSDRKHTWIVACRQWIHHSRFLLDLYNKAIHTRVLSTSVFMQYILAGRITHTNLPTLPLVCNTEADRSAMEDVYWYIAFIEKKNKGRVSTGACFTLVYNTVVHSLLHHNIPIELISLIWSFVITTPTQK